MKNTKKISCRIILTICILSLMITLGMVKNSSASDPETWKPLELTIDETRKDPTLLAYVTGRCSGLMFSLSKVFEPTV